MLFRSSVRPNLVLMTSLLSTSLLMASPEVAPDTRTPAPPTNSVTAQLAELQKTAQSYYDHGNYGKALELWESSLSQSEKEFGPDHPRIAVVLSNLGFCNVELGNYETALSLFQRALVIRERALGTNDLEVGFSLRNVAIGYHAQGNYEQSLVLNKRSLGILENALGPDHPGVATGLSLLADDYRAEWNYE